METTIINEIITRIINLVMVQQIYRNTRLSGDKPLTELILLISDKCSKTLIEYLPLMDMVLEDYPDYCYRLYHVHQVKDSIKKGNMFFYRVCNAENLFYTDPVDKLNLFSGMLSLEKLIDKGKSCFNKEMAKIQAFNDGAIFYWEKENYALSAFMVHQQIELAYRAIELFAMGKDKVTHSIRVHQKYVIPYLPVLGTLFDESNDLENKLMQHLDDAYLMVRYGENYQINKDKLVKAREKGMLVQQMVAEVYEKMTNEFEQKLLNRTVESEIFPPKNGPAEENEIKDILDDQILLNKSAIEIIAMLTASLPVERVYCINRKKKSFMSNGIFQKIAIEQSSTHFLLLVITAELNIAESFSIQNVINQNADIAATVTLLVHSIKNVNDALIDNNRFFHEVLRSDQLIYLNKNISGLMELPEYDGAKEYPNAEVVWRYRRQRAEALLGAGVNMTECETEVVEVSLLNQAMEQLCVGFIFATMGYKPNQQSLKHLANICRFITPMFEEAIPINTEEDETVFETLIDAVKDTRYHVPCNIDPTDVGLLHRRCQLWMDISEGLVASHIVH